MRLIMRTGGAALGVVLLLAGFGQAHAATGTGPAARPASVRTVAQAPSLVQGSWSGTVTDRATQAPLAGACVSAFATSPDVAVATVCAGADGVYTFTELPEGQLKLRATAAGHAPLWSGNSGNWLSAWPVQISAWNVSFANFKLYTGAGTVAGRIIDLDGQPMAGMLVWMTAGSNVGVPNVWSSKGYTGSDGRYLIDNVPPGDYLIRLSLGSYAAFYPQAASAAAAVRVKVLDGQQTDASEVFIRYHGIEVTVVDEQGRPPSTPVCVRPNANQPANKCVDSTGVVLFDQLISPDTFPSNTLSILAYAPNGTLADKAAVDVRLTRYQVTKVKIVMSPAGALATQAVDAGTGVRVTAPVCVTVHREGESGLRTKENYNRFGWDVVDRRNFCADADGDLVIGPIAPGRVMLFVTAGNGYGAQWVGAQGGTGDRRQAAVFTATLGNSIAITPIKLDRAGTITGVITDSRTSAPIDGVSSIEKICARPFAGLVSELHDTPAGQCADAQGRYVIGGLGPYQWPVQFMSFQQTYAQTWSGGGDNRFDATMISVVAGQTSTANVAMLRSLPANGMITDDRGAPIDRYFLMEVTDAETGDQVAHIGADGTAYFSAPALRPMRVDFWPSDNPAARCTYSVVNRIGQTQPSTLTLIPGSLHDLTFRSYLGCPQQLPAIKPVNPRNQLG